MCWLYLAWNLVLCQFGANSIFCRDRGAGSNRSDTEARAAGSMVVPLGRDVYVFGRHFDVSNADGSNGRGGLLSLTVWCGHHFRWVDGHDYVLKRVACHLAQPASGDCVDKS